MRVITIPHGRLVGFALTPTGQLTIHNETNFCKIQCDTTNKIYQIDNFPHIVVNGNLVKNEAEIFHGDTLTLGPEIYKFVARDVRTAARTLVEDTQTVSDEKVHAQTVPHDTNVHTRQKSEFDEWVNEHQNEEQSEEALFSLEEVLVRIEEKLDSTIAKLK